MGREYRPAESDVRVAFRSSQGTGAFTKKRWTELSLWFRPNDPRVPWLAVVAACSNMPGEHTIRTSYPARSIELALAHFKDGAPARSIRTQAAYWVADHGPLLEKVAARG